MDRIRRDGPLRFDAFMEAALYDPEQGFYAGGGTVRAGKQGDFVTAPTLSPVFAAGFARFVHKAWQRLGEPKDWLLVEPGGGTGAMLRGVVERLEALDAEAVRGIRVVLVDASPAHRKAAKKSLWGVLRGARVDVSENLPVFDAPAVVLVNELLDNLPVRLFVREEDAWWERVVGVDGAGGFRFERVEAASEWVQWIESFQVPIPDRHQVEVPVGAESWFAEISGACGDDPVVMALVDHGETARDLFGEPRPQGTLLAYEAQTRDRDVLVRPGERDITAHVNWSAVGRIARDQGWEAVAFTDQFAFLSSLGALEEAVRLAQEEATPEAMERLSALKEVLLPGGMGEAVKVLVLSRGLGGSGGDWIGLERVRELEPAPRRA